MVLLLVMTSLSWAGPDDYNPAYEGTRDVFKYTYKYEDDVEGEGYMVVRDNVNTNNLSLLEYMHGSGTVDYADLLSSKQKSTHTSDNYYVVTEEGGFAKKSKGANSEINYTIQKDLVQSPYAFAFGTGYYAANPVVYNSLLKEKTVAKSYQEAILIHHQLEYAHAYKGDVAVNLNCTGPTHDTKGKGSASMKIEDFVTQGTVHVGQLFTNTKKASTPYIDSKGNMKVWDGMKRQAWKKPIIEVDADYVGNFHIKKSIEIEIEKSKCMDEEDWLPCCYGGYFDMNEDDRKPLGEAGIFDCTCRNQSISTFKPAWNATRAQFPTATYQYKP
jgi:hypothetical protein